MTYLDVDETGTGRRTVAGDTVLVPVMAANNKVSALQPVAAVGAICASNGVLLHSNRRQQRFRLQAGSHPSRERLSAQGALYIRSRRPRAKIANSGARLIRSRAVLY